MTIHEELQRAVNIYAKALEEAYYEGYFDHYLDDAPDIEVIAGLCGDYRAAIIASGVDGIVFNTRVGCVQGHLEDDYAECHVPSYITDATDAYFAEQWGIYRY